MAAMSGLDRSRPPSIVASAGAALLARWFPALSSRDARWLLLGTAGSAMALWTLVLTNAWVVFELSDSSALVGVTTFAGMFPFLLSPLGGTVADAVERRKLLVVLRLLLVGVSAALLLLAALGALSVPLVLGLVFLQGVVRSVEMPAEQAHLANLVPPDRLGNAVTLHTTVRLGSRAVGPLAAGPFLATTGPVGAYAVAVVTALLGLAGVAAVWTRSRGGVTELAAVARNLREGLAFVVHTPFLRALFLFVVAHCVLTMSFDAMLPAFADVYLHEGSAGLSVMTVGVGSGAFAGTLLLAGFSAPGRVRGMLFLATAVLSGAAPLLMAASETLWAAAGSAVAMGSSQAMFMALASVLVQEACDDAVRGRVMSLFLMSAGGLMAVANLAFGSIADIVGIRALFAVPALAFLAIVAVSTLIGSLRAAYGLPARRLAPSAG